MPADTDQGSASSTGAGLPKKRRGETFGQYLQRITPEEEHAVGMSARWIGVTPRSIFESYIRPSRIQTSQRKACMLLNIEFGS